MRTPFISGTAAVLVSVFAVLPAAADEYDFELGLTYAHQRTDWLTAAGVDINGPMPEFGTLQSDTEADNYSLLGAWYYSGLRDADGPRSRAAFLGRTSSLALAYTYGEQSVDWSRSGTTPPAPSQPPSSGSYGFDRTSYGAQLRHVWADSGWYAIAGASRTELDDGAYDGGANRWEAGVGKYLARATALDLRIVDGGQTEIEFDRTSYGLNLSHIGALPGGWQYGSDLGIEYADDDGDYRKYGIALSLFPTNDLEFGLSYGKSEYYGLDDEDIGGFASWFLRDDIELRARYTSHDVPDREWSLDHDDATFDFGVNVRF